MLTMSLQFLNYEILIGFTNLEKSFRPSILLKKLEKTFGGFEPRPEKLKDEIMKILGDLDYELSIKRKNMKMVITKRVTHHEKKIKKLKESKKNLSKSVEEEKRRMIGKRGLIVYSGGLDSTTLLYMAKKVFSKVEALSFNYGSKHNEKELKVAKQNCEDLKINQTIIDLDFINNHFKSDLLKSGGEIPEGHYESENMRSTVVPFRNGIMMAIAAGIAESKDLDYICLANHAGDHAIYPDCRLEFIDSMNFSIVLGTGEKVRLYCPFTNLKKEEIITVGDSLKVDYAKTYSCYKGKEKHCGKCGTCVERKEAFKKAGIKDPTIYE